MTIVLSPSSGPTAGGTLVAITGNNLRNTSAVRFGTRLATIIGTPTNSLVNVRNPAGNGAVGVRVSAPGGTSIPVLYYYVPAPLLSAISSPCGPTAGGNTVTISGHNLKNAAVRFGAQPATVISHSTGSVTVAVPPGTGRVKISVTNAGGTATGSSYDYCGTLTPAKISISPNSGPISGGELITISDPTESGLGCATGVTIGGTAARFTIISDSKLGVVAPPGAEGPTNVVLTTCGTTTTTIGSYAYTDFPG